MAEKGGLHLRRDPVLDRIGDEVGCSPCIEMHVGRTVAPTTRAYRLRMELSELDDRLRLFAEERDWVKFHNPKNLALALGGEVGELMELLQWRSNEEIHRLASTADGARALGDELADVVIYLVRLAGVLEIDLSDSIERKIEANTKRFPRSDRL